MKTEVIMQHLAAKHPGESEYLQAVQEVLESIEEVYNQLRLSRPPHNMRSSR